MTPKNVCIFIGAFAMLLWLGGAYIVLHFVFKYW